MDPRSSYPEVHPLLFCDKRGELGKERKLSRFYKSLATGIETGTPREAIQRAYQVKWFDDERLWLQMLHDRNQTNHIYDEEVAKAIYQRIPSYYQAMNELLEKIKEQLISSDSN